MKAAVWKSSRMLAACVRAMLGICASAPKPVIDGAGYTHGQNVVHHDIKPANIMHKPGRGNLELNDLRLARKTKTGIVPSTLSYVSPAAASATKVHGCCDLLPLGVTLFQLCTGTPPIVSASTVTPLSAIANDPQSGFHSAQLALPAQLVAVTRGALAILADDLSRRRAKFVRHCGRIAPLTASA